MLVKLNQKLEEIKKEIFKSFANCHLTDWVPGAQMQCFHNVTYKVLKKNHCTTTIGYFIWEKEITFFLIHGDWSTHKEKMKEQQPLFLAKIDYSKQNKLQISPLAGQEIKLGQFCSLEFELFEKITSVIYNHSRHLAGKS